MVRTLKSNNSLSDTSHWMVPTQTSTEAEETLPGERQAALEGLLVLTACGVKFQFSQKYAETHPPPTCTKQYQRLSVKMPLGHEMHPQPQPEATGNVVSRGDLIVSSLNAGANAKCSVSGLLLAVVIFMRQQTPLLKSLKWECSCRSGG